MNETVASGLPFRFLALGDQNGLSLHFLGTLPRQLAPQDKQKYREIVTVYQRARRKTYFNGLKVGINAEKTMPPQDESIPSEFSYTAYPEYHAYYVALSGNPEVPKNIQEQVAHAGIQVVWLTTEEDGSNKLVMEVRSERSAVYPGALGTIGGGIDGKIQRRNSEHGWAQLDSSVATPEAIKDQGIRESKEELGITESDIASFAFVGVAQDKLKGQTDFLALARYKGTADQLQQQYEIYKMNGNDKLHDPMPKRLVMTAGNPETVQKILANPNISLPPISQAALLAAGRKLIMDSSLAKDTKQTGDFWLENTTRMIAHPLSPVEQTLEKEGLLYRPQSKSS